MLRSPIRGTGFRALRKGQAMRFDSTAGPKGPQAADITPNGDVPRTAARRHGGTAAHGTASDAGQAAGASPGQTA
ncbi:cold-shock protein [Streptomyces sp. ISL-94]|nr:cold-shock protein [Streptomyces sp. ISL-94]